MAELDWEAVEDRECATKCCWRVEAIDEPSEGECYVTVFSGLGAKERAGEYAAWKNTGAGRQSVTTNERSGA